MNFFSLSTSTKKNEKQFLWAWSIKQNRWSACPPHSSKLNFREFIRLLSFGHTVFCFVGDYNFVFHFHYFNALSSFVLQCFSVGIRILQTGQEKKEKFKIWIFLWQDFQYAGWVWTCVVFENWRTIFKMLEWVSAYVRVCVQSTWYS